MKITLAVATSQDGFINPPGTTLASDWTSDADKTHYAALLRRYKLQIMGQRTYDAYKDRFKVSSLFRRIILTRHPDDFEDIPGKIEFTDEPIPTLLQRLKADGFKHAILLGGGQIFSAFLEAGLVDEAYITVEPLTFGDGIPFLTLKRTMDDFAYLELDATIQLNNTGTKLLHYSRK